MIDCVNLAVLNGINVFPFTYLVASRGGSVVDYVLMKACDLSMVNEFKIDPLSLLLEPYLSYSINKCSKVKEERRYVIRPCYNKALIYAKEVENHLSKLSLGYDVKENWKHLKDVILEVGYQHF